MTSDFDKHLLADSMQRTVLRLHAGCHSVCQEERG